MAAETPRGWHAECMHPGGQQLPPDVQCSHLGCCQLRQKTVFSVVLLGTSETQWLQVKQMSTFLQISRACTQLAHLKMHGYCLSHSCMAQHLPELLSSACSWDTDPSYPASRMGTSNQAKSPCSSSWPGWSLAK